MIEQALLALLGGALPAGLILYYLKHYHDLRSALSAKMHAENTTAIIEVKTAVGEVRHKIEHVDECLDSLKVKTAVAANHEERISRLEDVALETRRRRKAASV